MISAKTYNFDVSFEKYNREEIITLARAFLACGEEEKVVFARAMLSLMT